MRGAIPPLHQYVFMVWCLVKHRDNFTFYLYSWAKVTQLSGIALGYGLDDEGFDSQRELGIFLFDVSSPALGPTQPPLQCVPGGGGSLSLGVKRPGREVDHSPSTSAEVKECVELYLHSTNTSSWRGAQLKKSTRTTLPFIFTRRPRLHTLIQNKCRL
jgi:hypothetical protein